MGVFLIHLSALSAGVAPRDFSARRLHNRRSVEGREVGSFRLGSIPQDRADAPLTQPPQEY
jgi:hypothetical protein